MPWYPDAKRRPISRNYTKRKITVVRAILHTDAGNAASLYGWWMDPRNKAASSHVHIAKNGVLEQYVDTDYMTWTSGEASDDSVGIETQGYGNEPWTPAQVRTLVKFLAWLCSVHPIPVRQMASSASSEKGIGWHRLGVNGNFPGGILAGRNQRGGGQVWSKATGKQCPGDDRIRQIPGIIAQVKGGGTPAPAPEPAPSTGGYTGGSLVEYLNHSKRDSSYAARATLASQYGITPYSGTAEQNTRLLASLRAASASPPPPVVTVERPSKTVATPTPTPEKDWFTMATESDLRRVIREEAPKAIWEHQLGLPRIGGTTTTGAIQASDYVNNRETYALAKAIAQELGMSEARILEAIKNAQATVVDSVKGEG